MEDRTCNVINEKATVHESAIKSLNNVGLGKGRKQQKSIGVAFHRWKSLTENKGPQSEAEVLFVLWLF